MEKLLLDSESKYGSARLRDHDKEVSTDVTTKIGYGRRGQSHLGRATWSHAGLRCAARALRRIRRAQTLQKNIDVVVEDGPRPGAKSRAGP
ncbi:hypothetical protein BHE74_00025920 [Ensete ventricosum]|nr:hypothetical protein BHE74_00025920 [Ensete ventricosum]